jgi:large subunit ribosomal protein L4
MSTIATYDLTTGSSGERELALDLGDKVLYRTIKDAIVQYQANRRQGDAHTKIRTELAGHKKKPWKQKGTGRARAGDRRSPLWVGGATTFGPRNKRRWGYHLPKKQRLVALQSALLGKIRDGEVKEVASLTFEQPSSKAARKMIQACAPKGTVLVLLSEQDRNVWLSFRNFPNVRTRCATDVNAYDLLAHKWVLAQEGALEVAANRLPASVGDPS